MIDYKQALYRRNNFGQPCVWYAEEYGNIGAIYHGIVNKTIRKESFVPKGKRSVTVHLNGIEAVGGWTMPDDSPFICFEPWDGYPDL